VPEDIHKKSHKGKKKNINTNKATIKHKKKKNRTKKKMDKG